MNDFYTTINSLLIQTQYFQITTEVGSRYSLAFTDDCTERCPEKCNPDYWGVYFGREKKWRLDHTLRVSCNDG